MHDPLVLVAHVKPLGLDIWHVEPNGHDSGEVCSYRDRWRHPHHWRLRWWPYLKPKRWLRDRCGECGRRFFWKDARFGYMSGDTVYHDKCMSLRQVRSQLDDLTRYVRNEADWDARFRVEYRLRQIVAEADVDGR